MSDRLVSYSSVLGVVVANKRKELNIEQSVMAEKMGLSQASYSRLESGKSTFSVDQLFQCSIALNVPIDELFESLLNTISSLESSGEVTIKSQQRGNTTKARESGSGVGAFVAGAGLAALIIGLAGKSK